MGWNIGSNEIEFQRDSPMIELILNHCHHHQRSESISYEVHGFITITLVEVYTCIIGLDVVWHGYERNYRPDR